MPLGASWKEERFLHPGKPPQIGWDRKAASEVQRRVQQPVCGRQERDPHRPSYRYPARPSPSRESAGTGRGRVLTLSLEDRPRERAAVGCAERAWRGWSVVWLQPGVSAEAQACHRTDEPLLSGAQRAGCHGRQPPPARTPGHRTPATASGAPDSADSGNPAAASGSHLGRLRGPSHRLGWHLHQPPSRQAPGADASELPTHRSRPETTAEPQGPRDLGSRAAISPCSCVSCVFTPPLPAL